MTEQKKSNKTVSSRQKIRKWILIISFLLIPVTIFYVSPIVIMMGAAEGIATGSMILFILLFVLSLFVARLWCGWLCPMGACQEFCSPVIKRNVKEGWRNWIKYGVTVFWLGMLGLTFADAGGVLAVDLFYGTENGISVVDFEILTMVVVIFLIILAVAFIAGRRGFCHVVCPIAALMVAGRKIRNVFGWPALQLRANPALCTDCSSCSLACPMGLDVHGMVKEGEMENADCILCASCADACPEGVISYEWGRR